MSLELVNTIATLGTFLVIAATGIAAMVQLRHMRSSNHIVALNELRETTESTDYRAAVASLRDLTEKLREPAFRYQIAEPSARTDENRRIINNANRIANFYESMGILIKTGLVDKELVFEMWADIARQNWERLAPFTAINRRDSGDALWENFECLAVLAQDWLNAHPKGTYPTGLPRFQLNDEYLDADRQYAASLAPT